MHNSFFVVILVTRLFTILFQNQRCTFRSVPHILRHLRFLTCCQSYLHLQSSIAHSNLLKILRVFKFIRYSKNMQILFKVLYKERHILFTVFLIAVAYIVTTALIMFNIEESDMFNDFFDALYWATTTLTTVGYGDIYPATDLGRIISMISAILGVAVIALPSGVITASYLEELREAKKEKEAEK